MKACPYCAEEIQDQAIKCKHCGSMLTAGQSPESNQGDSASANPPSPVVPEPKTVSSTKIAKRIRKSEFIGSGCLVQGIGLLCPFVGGALASIPGVVVGLVLALVLVIIGSSMSYSWKCGVCMNKIEGPEVAICPVCKAKLVN